MNRRDLLGPIRVTSVDKKYFAFNKGINTEAPLVGWPEGFTIDEQNFDLLQDGSRRRRQGIGPEAGYLTEYFTAQGAATDLTSATKVYRWRNVANDDQTNYIVGQVGSLLHFWLDPKAGPIGPPVNVVDLAEHRVNYTDPVTELPYIATEAEIASSPVSMSEMNGELLVVGKHIESVSIALEDGDLVIKPIKFLERDLTGIVDGIDIATTPPDLSEEHLYNLLARGWSRENIDEYKTQKGVYPAKNMIHFMGMRRQTTAAFTDEDGIKTFSPDKLEAELFQNMSAPIGHLTRDVFNRRVSYGSTTPSDPQVIAVEAVTGMSVDRSIGPPYRATITIKAAAVAHGVNVNDTIYIKDMILKLANRAPRAYNSYWRYIDGYFTVAEIVDANTFKIDYEVQSYYASFEKMIAPGQYTTGDAIDVSYPGTEPASTRFVQCAAFSGRVFYGGCVDTRLSERIYYSKVIEDQKDLGKVYQEADPTSEFISDLLPTDGGHIVIPNLGFLKAMIPYGRALLIFSSEGVWAIGPGEGGIFAATGYSVTKITDQGCLSGDSVIVADNIPMYWSEGGVFGIMQDQNAGFLSSQNLSQNVINGLYNSIRYTEKTRAKAAYDPIRKRVFWLYNTRLVNPPTGDAPRSAVFATASTTVTPLGILDDTDVARTTYNAALIFDLRLGAWTKWGFSCDSVRPIRNMMCLPAMYSTDTDNSALRFLCQDEGTQRMYIGELTNISYKDWGVSTAAYIYTGPDSLGEPERFKYAPYVHVFMRKEIPEAVVVEQSFAGGTQVSPTTPINLVVAVRTPSIYMQPRWDWARELDSGKVPNYVQVYREAKPNPNSFGVIVTKNKVRGRGRNLFLAFKAGNDSPAWIDGWTIKYDAQVRI